MAGVSGVHTPESSQPSAERLLSRLTNEESEELKGTEEAGTPEPGEAQNGSLESPTSSCYSPQNSLSSVALALYKAGLQFENQGRLAGAIGLYRQAIKLHPGLDRGIVCLDEPEQETAERATGDVEGDVHVDKSNHISRRTWDAARQAAAVDAYAAGSASSRRRGSFKRQDGTVASASPATADAETPELSPLMKIPEHLLAKVVAFLDTYAVAKFCMTCKWLQMGLWRLEDIWREKAKAAFAILPDPADYGNCWKRTFFEAPRLRLDGIYISKCVYLRRVRDVGNIHLDDRRRRTLQQLQQQLQQQLRQPTGAPISQELINNLAANSPVIAVTYYRYLRFMPANRVLVLRSEAEKQVAVAALKGVQARLEGKSGEPFSSAFSSRRAPELHGAAVGDQVVLGCFSFNEDTKTVTLEYTGKPHAASGPPPGPPAGAPQRGRGPPAGTGRGAAGARVPLQRDGEGPLGEGPVAPLHTAVLQLAHATGGRWNYRLKWKSLSVTSNTRYGPDESVIDVENENFRPFVFHRVISFGDYF